MAGETSPSKDRRIRAMADGSVDSQIGARICNGLGIMRDCLETQALQRNEDRMNEIADRAVANAADRHTGQIQRLTADPAHMQ